MGWMIVTPKSHVSIASGTCVTSLIYVLLASFSEEIVSILFITYIVQLPRKWDLFL